jgi:hypothetical protein
MRNKKWVRLLAYVTGSVNQELLLQNEYLAAENRILRAKLSTKLRLSNPERRSRGEASGRHRSRCEPEGTEPFNRIVILHWSATSASSCLLLRVTETSITQLGYTINLMLTLAGAALALGAKTLMESKEVLPSPHHYSFHTSVFALGLSVFLAVAANFTRAFDFRNTRRAARARMTGKGIMTLFMTGLTNDRVLPSLICSLNTFVRLVRETAFSPFHHLGKSSTLFRGDGNSDIVSDKF